MPFSINMISMKESFIKAWKKPIILKKVLALGPTWVKSLQRTADMAKVLNTTLPKRIVDFYRAVKKRLLDLLSTTTIVSSLNVKKPGSQQVRRPEMFLLASMGPYMLNWQLKVCIDNFKTGQTIPAQGKNGRIIKFNYVLIHFYFISN